MGVVTDNSVIKATSTRIANNGTDKESWFAGVGDNSVWVIAAGACSAVALFLLIATILYVRRIRIKNRDQDHVEEDKSFIFGLRGRSHPTGSTSSDMESYDLEMETFYKTGLVDNYSCVSSQSGGSRPSSRRGDSLTSSRSSDSDDDVNPDGKSHGRLYFSAWYDKETELITVHLIKIKGLRGRGMNQYPRDPFVRLYLLPDDVSYQQSRVKRRTLAPKFKEIFTFKLTEDDIPTSSLKFTIYDIDQKNVRHTLGHVIVPVMTIDLTSHEIVYKDLEATPQQTTYLGEMLIGLKSSPHSDRLRVTVLRAKNLPVKLEICNKIEVVVRVELYHGNELMKTKQTSGRDVRKLDYYETCSFGISSKFMSTCYLLFSVVLQPKTGVTLPPNFREEVFAKLVIGPYTFARGDEFQHWKDMLDNPRTSIERWHRLQAGPRLAS